MGRVRVLKLVVTPLKRGMTWVSKTVSSLTTGLDDVMTDGMLAAAAGLKNRSKASCWICSGDMAGVVDGSAGVVGGSLTGFGVVAFNCLAFRKASDNLLSSTDDMSKSLPTLARSRSGGKALIAVGKKLLNCLNFVS